MTLYRLTTGDIVTTRDENQPLDAYAAIVLSSGALHPLDDKAAWALRNQPSDTQPHGNYALNEPLNEGGNADGPGEQRPA